MPPLIAVAAVAGYQAYSSNKARKESSSASEEQYRLQQEQISKLEAKENEALLSEEKIRTRDQARSRQKLLAASASGRRNTILTSPLGVADSGATGQRKTLLGI